MAIVALIAEETSRKMYDADSTHALLETGSKLAEFCRTDPADPKTARFGRLRFLLMNSGRAWNTLSGLTAGISSTWNPEPPKTLDAPAERRTIRIIYSQKSLDSHDCSAILAAADGVARDDAVVVIVGSHEGIQELLLLMSDRPMIAGDCLRLVCAGFPGLSGEMAAFDTVSGQATTYDPRAPKASPEKEGDDVRSRATA